MQQHWEKRKKDKLTMKRDRQTDQKKRQSETNRESDGQIDTETASATSICHNPGTLLRAVAFSPTVL